MMKFFGVNASDAAEFSFLLSIPIILASGVVEIWEAVKTGMQISWLTTATGTLAAFVSGLVAVKTVLRAVKNKVGFGLPCTLSFPLYCLSLLCNKKIKGKNSVIKQLFTVAKKF